jgi:hypothetical protein
MLYRSRKKKKKKRKKEADDATREVPGKKKSKMFVFSLPTAATTAVPPAGSTRPRMR